MIDALDLGTFLTILLLTFSVVLLIAGAFTAYFGSGKSRKIGGGLLVGGLVIGVLWIFLVRTGGPLDTLLTSSVLNIVIQSIVVLLAAFLGAGAAIGLFLLAIMKS
jgi:hypothetical protein